MAPEWISRKKRFRLFTTIDHAHLRLTDRIVYSFLAYRARVGLPTTKAMLAAETGLQRVKTVPEAIVRLMDPKIGLAIQVDGGYAALEPSGEVAKLFYSLKDGEHWSQRLGYNWYYPAKDGLTTQQNYLLWLLYGTSGNTHNQTGLEKLSGLTRKTVAAALDRLEELDLVEITQRHGFRFGVRITDLDPGIFFEAEMKASGNAWTPEEAKIVGWLKLADIPEETGREKALFDSLVRDLLGCEDPCRLLIQAQAGHETYLKSKGGIGPPHCGYRLRIEIDNLNKKDKAA